jgi:hypothetical protein
MLDLGFMEEIPGIIGLKCCSFGAVTVNFALVHKHDACEVLMGERKWIFFDQYSAEFHVRTVYALLLSMIA